MSESDDSRAAAPYRVLARKWRPKDFSGLIGQEAMVRTLTNAFGAGRIAQAYMLTGVRGVGKTTTARILARALNYEAPGADKPSVAMPVEGTHCRAIMEGRHMDVIEMDAASHTGIDDIRDIIEAAQYAPAAARYKVYIIDEVHMLSKSAFNGLLKTLEEPPPHLKFVFATTEIRKVPVTVLSRCQRFDLRRIEPDVMIGHLRKIADAEGIVAGNEALAMIARAAEGSVRDALSLFDQAIAHSPGNIAAADVRAMLGLTDRARVVDLFAHVMKGDVGAALRELAQQHALGADPAAVMNDLAEFVHFVTRLKFVPEAAASAALSPEERDRGQAFAEELSVPALARAWQILLKGLGEIAATERSLAAAEMVLVKLAHAANLPTPDELVRSLQGEPSAPAAARHDERPLPGGTRATGDMRRAALAAPSAAAFAAAPAVTVQTEPAAPATKTLALAAFADVVMLAEDKRDIALRTVLRRNVRVVSFADGRMDIALAGNPPAGFGQDLSRKLTQWTGKRWIIATSREGGGPTLEEAEKAEFSARAADAESDPAVAAILERFPGSRVIDVRIRGASAASGVEAAGDGVPAPDDGGED
jgi:DNA polymerase-3 subunit gamma/tau